MEYDAHIDESYRVGKKTAFVTGSFAGTISLFVQAAIVFVVYWGGRQVLSQEISPGDLTSFLLYTLTVAMAFAFISR